MLSVLAWLVKIFNALQAVIKQNEKILLNLQDVQEQIEVIQRILGVGIPVTETIEWAPPKNK